MSQSNQSYTPHLLSTHIHHSRSFGNILQSRNHTGYRFSLWHTCCFSKVCRRYRVSVPFLTHFSHSNLCTPQANSCMQISFIDSYCDSLYGVSVGGRLYGGCRPTSRGVFCLSCLICASRLSSPCRRQKRRGGPIRARE